MKIKKILLLLIILSVSLLLIIMIFNRDKIKNYIEVRQKNNFILEVQNIMNIASNYFLRVLDPKIDKSEPVVGEITISKLIKKDYLKENIKIEGKIKVSILGDDTNYIIILSNDKYSYVGNYNDLDITTIKNKTD